MRPWRWAKIALIGTLSASFIVFPSVTSTWTGNRIVPYQLTTRENMVQKIEGELGPRTTKLTSTEVREVAEVIVDEAQAVGIDPFLVVAVIETESRFDVEAVSSTGARGLMQILPSTFKAVSDAPRMFDPVENVRAGIAYMSLLQKQFKKPERMLLAYNVGPGGVINGTVNDYPAVVMSKYRSILERNGLKISQRK